MHKLALLLILLAPIANADQFYVGMAYGDAAALHINKNLPLPEGFQQHDGLLWGFVPAEEESTSDYLDSADAVYVIGSEHKTNVLQACPYKAPPCIISLFKE